MENVREIYDLFKSFGSFTSLCEGAEALPLYLHLLFHLRIKNQGSQIRNQQ